MISFDIKVLSSLQVHRCTDYILSINRMSFHTVDDVRLIISEAPLANRKLVDVAFTKDDATNYLSAVGLPQLYFYQLLIINGHITNMFLAVLHKAITGPKFNHRTLQKQPNSKDWIAAEWIQLGNYSKQNMCGPPYTAPIDESNISGSDCIPSSPTTTIARKLEVSLMGPLMEVKQWSIARLMHPPHNIYMFRLKIDMPALLGVCIWHADVTNAFAEA
jgi:hypothetical protein